MSSTADTVTITVRVETPMLGWHFGQVVDVERTAFVDVLLAGARLSIVADPESEALDQGDEPDVDEPDDGEDDEDLEDDEEADAVVDAAFTRAAAATA